MPLLFVFFGGSLLGGIGGFVTGGGLTGAANLIKWGVIGSLLFFSAKHFKVV